MLQYLINNYMFSVSRRGSLLSAAIFVYAATSPINGYAGGSMYARFGGKLQIKLIEIYVIFRQKMDQTNGRECLFAAIGRLWHSVCDKFCRHLLSCIASDSIYNHGWS